MNVNSICYVVVVHEVSYLTNFIIGKLYLTISVFGGLVESVRRLIFKIVKLADDVKDFQVLPGIWVVERTFGWLDIAF
jgi:hypothetical protein